MVSSLRSRITTITCGVSPRSLLRKQRDLGISEKNKGENNAFFGKHHNEQTRSKMSEKRAKGISEGRISCGPRGKKGLYESTKSGTQRYDSFYELLRMKMLDIDDNVVMWTKQHGIQIPYYFEINRKYVPDFLIQKTNCITIEEIKGYENPKKT